MHTISRDIPTGRTRRTYSTSFKSELIEQCRQVGVSCSAVAISHGLNPNVLRRWIKEAADPSDAAPPAPKPVDVELKPAFVAAVHFVAGSRFGYAGVAGEHPVHDTQIKRLRQLNCKRPPKASFVAT